MGDVAHRCEAILGHPVQLRSLTPANPPPDLPPDFTEMLLGTEEFDSVLDMTTTAAALGTALTTVDQFLRAGLASSS